VTLNGPHHKTCTSMLTLGAVGRAGLAHADGSGFTSGCPRWRRATLAAGLATETAAHQGASQAAAMRHNASQCLLPQACNQ